MHNNINIVQQNPVHGVHALNMHRTLSILSQLINNMLRRRLCLLDGIVSGQPRQRRKDTPRNDPIREQPCRNRIAAGRTDTFPQ